MPKYGDLIKVAREQDDQKTRKPKDQNSVKPDEDLVNLCVKIPRRLRQHWAAEAKRQGITMTEVIVVALKQEFGEP